MKTLEFLELTKPRIATLVLATSAVGYFVATRGDVDVYLFIKLLLGVFLVAGGANAINQFIERDTDAKMLRTEKRPIPSGRLDAQDALLFGIGIGLLGSIFLAVAVDALCGFLAAMTLASYVFLYTPLKRRTTWNTVIGAVPGALPPVIGWAAAGAGLDLAAWSLFAIVFLWQFPHFFAIASIYREDYERAQLKMLPSADADGKISGLVSFFYCLVLLPVSLMPTILGVQNEFYFYGALALGIFYLGFTLLFWLSRDLARSKYLLRASIVYLPALFGLMVFDI